MKPTLSKEAVKYLQNYLNGKFYEEQTSEVMDELFTFGAYYSWGEENYGKHCRDNTVHGFLSVLQAAVEEIASKKE